MLSDLLKEQIVPSSSLDRAIVPLRLNEPENQDRAKDSLQKRGLQSSKVNRENTGQKQNIYCQYHELQASSPPRKHGPKSRD